MTEGKHTEVRRRYVSRQLHTQEILTSSVQHTRCSWLVWSAMSYEREKREKQESVVDLKVREQELRRVGFGTYSLHRLLIRDTSEFVTNNS